MKAKIATSSFKRNEDIWWEYVNSVKAIPEEEFTWIEF